jgi:tetratricopeptide (TPR) repeat protein
MRSKLIISALTIAWGIVSAIVPLPIPPVLAQPIPPTIAQRTTVEEIDRLLSDSLALSKEGRSNSLRKAVSQLERALELSRTVEGKDKKISLICLVALGHVFILLNEYQKSLDYYNQALLVSRTVRNLDVEAVALNKLGNIYHILGKNNKAIEYLDYPC